MKKKTYKLTWEEGFLNPEDFKEEEFNPIDWMLLKKRNAISKTEHLTEDEVCFVVERLLENLATKLLADFLRTKDFFFLKYYELAKEELDCTPLSSKIKFLSMEAFQGLKVELDGEIDVEKKGKPKGGSK